MVCGEIPPVHDVNVNKFESNNGAYINADKKNVLKWFESLKEANRVEFVCGLFQLCSPVELRFYGSCLEDIARKDYLSLRQFDIRANSINGFSDLDNLKKSLSDNCKGKREKESICQNLPPPFNALMFDAELRNNLIITLSLLRSNNHSSAHFFFSALLADALTNIELNSGDGISYDYNKDVQYHPSTDLLQSLDWPAIDECLLIYTLAAFHPAFSFSQRKCLFDRLLAMNSWCSMCQHVRNFRLNVFENVCRPVRSPFDCKSIKHDSTKMKNEKNIPKFNSLTKEMRWHSVPCLHQLDISNQYVESSGYSPYFLRLPIENKIYDTPLKTSLSARSFVGNNFKKNYICYNCSRIARKGRIIGDSFSHKRSKSIGDVSISGNTFDKNVAKVEQATSLTLKNGLSKNNTAVVHLKTISSQVPEERSSNNCYPESVTISFAVSNISSPCAAYPSRSTQILTPNLPPAINVPSPSILTPQPMTLVKNLSPSGRNTLLKLESPNNTLVAYNHYGLSRNGPKCISNDLNMRSSVVTHSSGNSTAVSSSSSHYTVKRNLSFLESNSYRRIPCSSHCCRPLPPPRRHSSASSHLSTPPSEESSSGNNTSSSDCFRPKSSGKTKCCQNLIATHSGTKDVSCESHIAHNQCDVHSENNEEAVQSTITRSSLEQDSSLLAKEKFFITSSEDEENNKNVATDSFQNTNVPVVSSPNISYTNNTTPLLIRTSLPPPTVMPQSALCTYGNPIYGNSFNIDPSNSFHSNAAACAGASMPQGYAFNSTQTSVIQEPLESSSNQNTSTATCDTASSINASTAVTYSLPNSGPDLKSSDSTVNHIDINTSVLNNSVLEANALPRQYFLIPSTQYGGSSRLGHVQSNVDMPNSDSLIWSPNPPAGIASNVCYPAQPHQSNLLSINTLSNGPWGCFPFYATQRAEIASQSVLNNIPQHMIPVAGSQPSNVADSAKTDLASSFDSVVDDKSFLINKEDSVDDSCNS